MIFAQMKRIATRWQAARQSSACKGFYQQSQSLNKENKEELQTGLSLGTGVRIKTSGNVFVLRRQSSEFVGKKNRVLL